MKNTKLLCQGHGSYRITSGSGFVIYVDPYAGGGYDLPADLILVTHGHHDHNKIRLVTQKLGCQIITNAEALAGGKHNRFSAGEVDIQAVEAKNLLHSPKRCVGYIITVNSVKIYAAGDTSETEQMKSFAALELDYALLPCGGSFMSLKGAAKCAELIGAKHNIPVHIKLGSLYDRKRAEMWTAPNTLIVEPGQEIQL